MQKKVSSKAFLQFRDLKYFKLLSTKVFNTGENISLSKFFQVQFALNCSFLRGLQKYLNTLLDSFTKQILIKGIYPDMSYLICALKPHFKIPWEIFHENIIKLSSFPRIVLRIFLKKSSVKKLNYIFSVPSIRPLHRETIIEKK